MELKHFLACAMRSISPVFGVFALIAVFGMQASARPAYAASPSFVRIIHAAPGIGTADVFVDGATLLSNFQFASVTGYATIPPGPHHVQVALIGTGPNAAVITQTLSVNPGVAYTVAALGTQSTGFSLDVFIDNNQLAPGMAKLRVYHLSPGIGAVNVANGGSTVIRGLNYPQASNYLTFQAGSYTFDLTSTQSNATMSVPATLKANMVTSIFAVGVFDGNPQFQFVTAQATGLPGTPLTGSDPNPNVASGNSQALLPWLFIPIALIVIGSGVLTRRLLRR